MTDIFKVKGIMCQNCVHKVTQALTALGAERVSVSEDYSSVSVTHSGLDRVKISSAIAAIDGGKFTVLEG